MGGFVQSNRKEVYHAAHLLTCLSFLDFNKISLDLFRATVSSEPADQCDNTLAESWKKILSPEPSDNRYPKKSSFKRMVEKLRKKRPSISQPFINVSDLRKCFDTLRAYSFVNQTSGPSCIFSTHKLVAEWGFYRLTHHRRRRYSLQTLLALRKCITRYPEGRSSWESLLTHCVANFGVLQKSFPQGLITELSSVLDLLLWFGKLARDAG